MSYVILAHVATGDVATAALHNQLLDNIAILATSVNTADGSILAPAAIIGQAQGNAFGYRTGSTASPTTGNTNIVLYNDGATSWSGIGVNASGVFYIATGTGAGVAARFQMDGAGATTFSGSLSVAGAAALSSTLTAAGAAQFGGVVQVGSVAGLSASFPAWRNTGAQMEAVLGNQADWANVKAQRFISATTGNNLADLTVGAMAINGGATFNSTVTVNGGLAAASYAIMADALPRLRGYSEAYQGGTISAGVVTVNLDSGNHVAITLSANITSFTLSSPTLGFTSGQVTPIVFYIISDGVARTITWTMNTIAVKFSSGVAPTLSGALGAGRIDKVVVLFVNGLFVTGEQTGYNMA